MTCAPELDIIGRRPVAAEPLGPRDLGQPFFEITAKWANQIGWPALFLHKIKTILRVYHIDLSVITTASEFKIFLVSMSQRIPIIFLALREPQSQKSKTHYLPLVNAWIRGVARGEGVGVPLPCTKFHNTLDSGKKNSPNFYNQFGASVATQFSKFS